MDRACLLSRWTLTSSTRSLHTSCRPKLSAASQNRVKRSDEVRPAKWLALSTTAKRALLEVVHAEQSLYFEALRIGQAQATAKGGRFTAMHEALRKAEAGCS